MTHDGFLPGIEGVKDVLSGDPKAVLRGIDELYYWSSVEANYDILWLALDSFSATEVQQFLQSLIRLGQVDMLEGLLHTNNHKLCTEETLQILVEELTKGSVFDETVDLACYALEAKNSTLEMESVLYETFRDEEDFFLCWAKYRDLTVADVNHLESFGKKILRLALGSSDYFFPQEKLTQYAMARSSDRIDDIIRERAIRNHRMTGGEIIRIFHDYIQDRQLTDILDRLETIAGNPNLTPEHMNSLFTTMENIFNALDETINDGTISSYLHNDDVSEYLTKNPFFSFILHPNIDIDMFMKTQALHSRMRAAHPEKDFSMFDENRVVTKIEVLRKLPGMAEMPEEWIRELVTG